MVLNPRRPRGAGRDLVRRRALYESGPRRAISQLAATFEQLAELRLLTLDNPALAASHFNWPVMAEPINRAVLLGDGSIPTVRELSRHSEQSVAVFLAAYGAH